MSENLDEEVKSSVLDLKHETGNRELVNGFSRSRSLLVRTSSRVTDEDQRSAERARPDEGAFASLVVVS